MTQRPGAVDGLRRDHVVPRLAAVTAGVHRERSAHRAGHACHPFSARCAVLGDITREVRSGHATSGAKRERSVGRGDLACDVDADKRVVREHHRAREILHRAPASYCRDPRRGSARPPRACEGIRGDQARRPVDRTSARVHPRASSRGATSARRGVARRGASDECARDRSCPLAPSSSLPRVRVRGSRWSRRPW